jgi:hypothetical protein
MTRFPLFFRGKFAALPLALALFMFVCTLSLHGQIDSIRRPVDDMVFKVIVYGPSDEIFIRAEGV